MKKAAIFYFSLKDAKDRQHVSAGPVRFSLQIAGYIRCEPVETNDLSTALDLARPRHDEVVMNAHWIQEPK